MSHLRQLSSALNVELTSAGALNPELIPSLTRLAQRAAWQGDCLMTVREDRYSSISKGKKGPREAGHRAIVLLIHGALGPGVVARHTCDRKGCINPKHLIPGTQSQNVRDAHDRGRATTRKARGESSGRATLTADVVTDMRRRARNGERIQAIADRHGVKHSAAWQAIRGISWQHLQEPPVPHAPRRSRGSRLPYPDREALKPKGLELWASGMALQAVADELGVSKRRIQTWIKQERQGEAA